MRLRQIALVNIGLHPDLAQVGHGVEHVAGIDVLPLRYFPFGHDSVGGGVDREIDLRLVGGRDGVDLLWSQPPEFVSATTGGDEFVRTGNRLRLVTAGQPLAVPYRKLVLLGAGNNFRTVDFGERLATSHGLASEIQVQLVNAAADASADVGQLCFWLIDSSYCEQLAADQPVLDHCRLQPDGTLLVLRHLNACRRLSRVRGSSRAVLMSAVLGSSIPGTGFRPK